MTFWFTVRKKGFESYVSDMVLGPCEIMGVLRRETGLLKVDTIGFCRGHFGQRVMRKHRWWRWWRGRIGSNGVVSEQQVVLETGASLCNAVIVVGDIPNNCLMGCDCCG